MNVCLVEPWCAFAELWLCFLHSLFDESWTSFGACGSLKFGNGKSARPTVSPVLSRRPVGREAARGSWPPALLQTQQSTRPLLCRPRASHRTAPAAKDIWSGQPLSLIVFFPRQCSGLPFSTSVPARIPFLLAFFCLIVQVLSSLIALL